MNSVGSPRPNWRELDDQAMQSTIIVDSYEAANKEAGDIILSDAVIHAEAGEVFSGAKPLSSGDTTVFKSVGIAIQDLASARLVYDRFLAEQTRH